MHAAVGITYCDYFVTNDGFVTSCCDFALGKMNAEGMAGARVLRSLQALADLEVAV
jgi:hypothetical protein